MSEDMQSLEARDAASSMAQMQVKELEKEMASLQDHNTSLRHTLDLLRQECDARVEALLSTQDKLRETEVQLTTLQHKHTQLEETVRKPDEAVAWRAKSFFFVSCLDARGLIQR